MSSREFNQNAGGAKRAALHGPVYITDRGRPSFVLLTYAAYQELARTAPTIVELLADHADAELPIETSRDLPHPAQLD
jgi:prevent-host-death family protein